MNLDVNPPAAPVAATAGVAPVARLGLIGDVHSEPHLLEAALAWLGRAGVDAIACTGDVADGPGDIHRCCDLLTDHAVATVRGNHDRWILADRARHIPHAQRRADLAPRAERFLLDLPVTRRIGTVAGDLLLCHGIDGNDLRKVWPGSPRMPVERSHELDRLIDHGATRWVVNGHLHYRCIIDFAGLTLINAGTLKRNHRPGFLRIDFGAGTVEFLGFTPSGRVLRQDVHPLRAGPVRRTFASTAAFDGGWEPPPLY